MAVILQPDGSLAFLPAWMLDESAARFTIQESPTFSLAFLQSLRVEIDALLASLLSDSKPGDDRDASKKRLTRNVQQSLFDQETPDITLPLNARDQIAAAIEALMVEIAKALTIREVGDDQDHD